MQTPWARREDAAKTQWRLHRLREVSVQTPPPPAAFLRRPCASSLRAHGVPVALWETSLRCYCAVTATPRRSYGAHSDRSGNAEPRRALCACSKCAPWHGVLGDPTASSGDVTAMPRRSRRSHCAYLGVLKFSWTPCNRREDATLVWQGHHMRPRCVRTASSRRSWRHHCAVTALPLRTHGVFTALIQIAVGTPSHGAHFVHVQSARRGMAS